MDDCVDEWSLWDLDVFAKTVILICVCEVRWFLLRQLNRIQGDGLLSCL